MFIAVSARCARCRLPTIEEAVRRIIRSGPLNSQAGPTTGGMAEAEVDDLVDEAVAWRVSTDAVLDYQCAVQCADFAARRTGCDYRAWRASRFELVTSTEQLDELRRAVSLPQAENHFARAPCGCGW